MIQPRAVKTMVKILMLVLIVYLMHHLYRWDIVSVFIVETLVTYFANIIITAMHAIGHIQQINVGTYMRGVLRCLQWEAHIVHHPNLLTDILFVAKVMHTDSRQEFQEPIKHQQYNPFPCQIFASELPTPIR